MLSDYSWNMLDVRIFTDKSVTGTLTSGIAPSVTAVWHAIRKIKLPPPPPPLLPFIPEKLTLGMEGFFQLTVARQSCLIQLQQPVSQERLSSDLFWIIVLPRPRELCSSRSDYFREQVLWQMLCAEVWVRDTSPEWCSAGSTVHLFVLMRCDGFLDCVAVLDIYCDAETN